MPVIRREGGHGDEEMIVVCAERAAKMFARVMRTEAALHGEQLQPVLLGNHDA